MLYACFAQFPWGLGAGAFGPSGCLTKRMCIGLGPSGGSAWPITISRSNPSRRTLLASDSPEIRHQNGGGGGGSCRVPAAILRVGVRCTTSTRCAPRGGALQQPLRLRQPTSLQFFPPFCMFCKRNPRFDSYAARLISCLLCWQAVDACGRIRNGRSCLLLSETCEPVVISNFDRAG
jgi:hypothetical protein